MSEFKKNNVPDKYRFRFYRRNGQHPFLVVMVETKEDEIIIDKIKNKKSSQRKINTHQAAYSNKLANNLYDFLLSYR